MKLTLCENAVEFLALCGEQLSANEAADNLMMGVALQLRDRPGFYKNPPYLGVISEVGLPVLAALMTPPYRILLTAFAPVDTPALELLSRDLISGNWPVPGTNAEVELSTRFAQVYTRLAGCTARPGEHLRIYALHQVSPVQSIPGGMRKAEPGDISLLQQWITAFSAEAIPHDPPPPPEWAEQRVARGEIAIWEDGLPVSMALVTRPVSRSITVSGVYTPPDHRRKGYASALVAALSQQQLDRGYQFCSLFTNLANPTSNSIYQKIGYRPVTDFLEYWFDCPGRG